MTDKQREALDKYIATEIMGKKWRNYKTPYPEYENPTYTSETSRDFWRLVRHVIYDLKAIDVIADHMVNGPELVCQVVAEYHWLNAGNKKGDAPWVM